MATINGTAGNDDLAGTSEADTLNGLAGNDTLNGGAGVDVLVGNSGDDTYTVQYNTSNGAFDTVTEVVDNGNDIVFVDVSTVPGGTTFVGPDNVEAISALDQSGSQAFSLTGGVGTTTIVGNAGVNTLTGSLSATSAQTLIGLGGNDTYNVSRTNQAIREDANGGNDTLNINFTAFTTAQAAAGYVLAAGAEVETINLTNAGRVTGSASVQTINGSGGDDTIDGGGGADSLAGGAGNDVYSVSAGAFVNDTAGTDRVIASTAYALATGPATGGVTTASGVEFLELAGRDTTATTVLTVNTATGVNFLVGDATSQTLIGNASDNILLGKANGDVAGNDTLFGLAGSDTYRVYSQADVVVEGNSGTTAAAIAATGGFDTVFTSASYSLLTNDTAAAAAAAALGITDAAAVQQIEVLSMAQQAGVTNSTLTGNTYANTIIGDAGANTLNTGGGTGVDRLNGLGGNDTFNVDILGTFIEEGANGGDDVVNVSVATTAATATTPSTFYTLTAGAQVETINLTVSGSVSGNEFAQTINGTANADTLIGGGGTDTLNGGGGADTFVVDSQDDVINDAVDAVNDTVLVSPTIASSVYALTAGADIEILRAAPYNGSSTTLATRATGTTGIDLVGNNTAQLITGDNGSNTILGATSDGTTGGAFDTLAGLSGDDIYRVFAQSSTTPANSDVVLEGTDGGNDIVFTNVNFSLLANAANALAFADTLATQTTDEPTATNGNIETLSAADQASVTSLTLLGDAGANTIIGNNGSNILGGGAGVDTLIGLGRADQFYFDAFGAANADVIQDFNAVNGGDEFLLNSTVFTGLTASGAELSAASFSNTGVATSAAGTAQIVYNSATGQLFYDTNGSTAGGTQLIATITAGTQLIASDILLTATAPTI